MEDALLAIENYCEKEGIAPEFVSLSADESFSVWFFIFLMVIKFASLYFLSSVTWFIPDVIPLSDAKPHKENMPKTIHNKKAKFFFIFSTLT